MIFQNQEERKGDAHSAIDKLYRAEMVKVVYDPDGSIMAKDMKGGDGSDDEEMKKDSESEEEEMT